MNVRDKIDQQLNLRRFYAIMLKEFIQLRRDKLTFAMMTHCLRRWGARASDPTW